MRRFIWWLPLAAVLMASESLFGTERKFDFSTAPIGGGPPDTTSIVAGDGKPGDWKVVLDDVPLPPDPFMSNAVRLAKKSVVAQLARDHVDKHFPILLLGKDTYDDFTLTTRFKLVDGDTEQMAGLVFRLQDEGNFYYVRASGLGGTLYFCKFENGALAPPVGNRIQFEKGVWHELTVKCTGKTIEILLDGQPAMPKLTDPTFLKGRIGLLTKSDSVSYFADTRVTYVPKVNVAQDLVDQTMKDNGRLLGVTVAARSGTDGKAHVIAGTDATQIGQPGSQIDEDVIMKDVQEYHRDGNAEVVTMPLCDRNGDPMAAVQIRLRAVTGDTEENAFLRAMPIIKTMQLRVTTVKSLTD